MWKIDAMVAEKVMGMVWYESSTEHGWKFKSGAWATPDERAPEYSTDISAALEVVEKMRADGWKFSVSEWEGNSRIPKGLLVAFRNSRSCVGVRESLSLAICEAALYAAGVKASEIQAAMEAKPCGD